MKMIEMKGKCNSSENGIQKTSYSKQQKKLIKIENWPMKLSNLNQKKNQSIKSCNVMKQRAYTAVIQYPIV